MKKLYLTTIDRTDTFNKYETLAVYPKYIESFRTYKVQVRSPYLPYHKTRVRYAVTVGTPTEHKEYEIFPLGYKALRKEFKGKMKRVPDTHTVWTVKK